MTFDFRDRSDKKGSLGKRKIFSPQDGKLIGTVGGESNTGKAMAWGSSGDKQQRSAQLKTPKESESSQRGQDFRYFF